MHNHQNQDEYNYHNEQQGQSSIQEGLNQTELWILLVEQGIPRGKMHAQSTRVLLAHSKEIKY